MAMRVVRAAAVDVRRLWMDQERTLPQAAAALGMSVDALQARATRMKLPPRRGGRREVVRPGQEAEFRVMWAAGISARQIGLYFGCSYFATINTARRLGLAPRGANFRPKMTVAQFLEVRLAVAMTAAIERERGADR